MSGFSGWKSIRDFRETGPWSESENAEEIANTLCSFMPFPRVVHASHHHVSLPKAWDLVKVLLFCRRFSKAPDKISLKVPSFAFLFLHSIHHRGFAPLPIFSFLMLNRRMSIFSDTSRFRFFNGIGATRFTSNDWWIVAEALTTSETLGTVGCFSLGERGEGWARALDAGLCADTPLSSVDGRS